MSQNKTKLVTATPVATSTASVSKPVTAWPAPKPVARKVQKKVATRSTAVPQNTTLSNGTKRRINSEIGKINTSLTKLGSLLSSTTSTGATSVSRRSTVVSKRK